MSNFSLSAFFGLDTKKFKHGLEDAQRSVSRFQRLVGAIGVGIGLNQLANAFRAIVKYANESESGINKNVDAVQRWSRSVDDLKNKALAVGADLVGSLNRAGEWFGDSISKSIYGATQAQLDAIRQSEAAIAKLEELVKKQQEENVRLGKEALKIEEDNDKRREKMAFDRMSDLEKEADLKRKIAKIDEESADIRRSNSANAPMTDRDRNRVAQLDREKIETEEQIAKITEARQKRELDLEGQIAQVKLDAAYAEMDDAERLLELPRRLLEAEKARADMNPFTASTEDALAAELEIEKIRSQVADKEREIMKERERKEEEIAKKKIETEEQIAKTIKDRTSASLSDLESGKFGRGRAAQARRIRQLEERATRARVRGQDATADRLAAKAGELRDKIPGLRDSDRSAEKVMEAGFDKTVSKLEKIDDSIKKLGDTGD